MVLLLPNTGLLRRELLSLHWESMNFERAMLTVVGDTAKNSKTRHARLNEIAV